MSEEAFREGSFQSASAAGDETVDPARVREELRRIVASRHFQASRRGKEFLQYVVNQKNDGQGELLKERLIGAHIFGRNPDYSTGEDPVVRVQAGDVRRRLERYYADPNVQSDILIHIPLGSYVPVFHLRRGSEGKEPTAEEVIMPASSRSDSPGATQFVQEDLPGISVDAELKASATTDHWADALGAVGLGALHVAQPDQQHSVNQREAREVHPPKREGWGRARRVRVAVPVVVCLALVSYFIILHFHKPPESVLQAFWAPTSLSARPVLLCLPRPMVYRPSDKLFDRYEKTHPNAFSTREARQDHVLPLEPSDTIQWGDMTPIHNSGPGIGGVVAAINITKLLTEQGIRFELRFGEEAAYAEMRDSPVVLVGAINTDWTTELTSELNFVFDETRGAPNIHEREGAKRVWKMSTSDGQITRDYGMITRQLSGKAGQFLVQVAGISHFGTEAASEFLANKKEFTTALRTESISLQKRNIQILVSTDVTAGRAGPPHVVAATSW